MEKQEFLRKSSWAVVGASTNREKYGNRVYRCLREHEYDVFPINPGADTVEGDAAYAELADLPELPEVVNLVVPPAVGISVVKTCLDLGIQYIWMQPGAESKEIVEYCRENGLNALANVCVLRELGC